MGKWFGTLALVGLASLAKAADWHYPVRAGDSLWTICQQYSAHADDCARRLARHNHLTDPDRLVPGTLLRIPTAWLKDAPLSARVTAVRGDVMRYPAAGGPARALADDQPMAFGDALETGEGSARLRFPDQADVLLKPRSLLVVQRYARRPGRAGDTGLRLQRGAVHVYRPPPVEKKSRFRVYTPGGAVTVRGASYDLAVDQQDITRGEARAGALVVDAGGRRVTLRAGQGIRLAPGAGAVAPRALLPAPRLTAHGGRHGLHAAWPSQPGAEGYWLEVYGAPEGILLAQNRVAGDDWRRTLPPGHYRLRLGAVDGNGLRGRVAEATVRVGASRPPSAPVATAAGAPPAAAPRRVAEPAPPSHTMRDALIFVGAAALMTLL